MILLLNLKSRRFLIQSWHRGDTMSDVVNRTTLEYRRSVNTPDFPSADWIINPDLSAILTVPQKHRKINGDLVVEMTQSEKDAVDAVLAQQLLTEQADSAAAAAANLAGTSPALTGLTLTNDLAVADGGTGSSNAPGARTNLGIEKASAAASLGGIAGFAGFQRAYRIPLTSGSGGADGFQLQLLVGESSGSSGMDFHIDGSSQDFPSGEDSGGDFKFVKANGDAISFYVERVGGTSPNRVATIWVALPNGTSRDIIFLLTNNSTGIANQSDSAAVFPAFFDTFGGTALDTAKWTALNSTGLAVGGGSMRHTNSSAQLRSNASFSSGVILELLWRGVTRNTNGHIVGGFGNATFLTTDSIGYLWHPGNDFVRNGGSWFGQASIAMPVNTEILLRITPTTSGFFSFVNFRHENYSTGAQLYNRTFGNAVVNENIFLGHRFDTASFGNQAMDMSWRWVRIRQQGTAPTIGTVREV